MVSKEFVAERSNVCMLYKLSVKLASCPLLYMQMVLNGDDLYPRDCDPECVQEEGQVAYCVGEQFRDRVTLVRIKHGMYEYKITGDVTYEELLAKSANKKRLIVHKPSLDGWEYMDTVEIPHAAQFIQDYSSLVPELTSKL